MRCLWRDGVGRGRGRSGACAVRCQHGERIGRAIGQTRHRHRRRCTASGQSTGAGCHRIARDRCATSAGRCGESYRRRCVACRRRADRRRTGRSGQDAERNRCLGGRKIGCVARLVRFYDAVSGGLERDMGICCNSANSGRSGKCQRQTRRGGCRQIGLRSKEIRSVRCKGDCLRGLWRDGVRCGRGGSRPFAVRRLHGECIGCAVGQTRHRHRRRCTGSGQSTGARRHRIACDRGTASAGRGGEGDRSRSVTCSCGADGGGVGHSQGVDDKVLCHRRGCQKFCAARL